MTDLPLGPPVSAAQRVNPNPSRSSGSVGRTRPLPLAHALTLTPLSSGDSRVAAAFADFLRPTPAIAGGEMGINRTAVRRRFD
jgi:hypothetical protein